MTLNTQHSKIHLKPKEKKNKTEQSTKFSSVVYRYLGENNPPSIPPDPLRKERLGVAEVNF